LPPLRINKNFIVKDDGVINDRSLLLLKTLVESYIRDGQPVGSKALVQQSGLSVSSATVRNVMAELEEFGYIQSPHTSAGRVPTQQGYRLFVDNLISVRPLGRHMLTELEQELAPGKSSQQLVASASQFLSTVSSWAGLVTVPRREQTALRQVEFLPLSGNRVLVVLIVNESEVQNRIIHTSRPYSDIELTQAANLINQRYAGQPLSAVRDTLFQGMRQDRSSINQYLQASLDLASQAFQADQATEPDYVVAGESRLLADGHSVTQLRELFDAFERKKDILELVDRSIHADGVQIFIGEESGFEVLGDFSVVTSSYGVDGESLGVLGVIGPTRMAYEKVIPIVDLTAKMLSSALEK
jgi:heat-inducible transcriptional repressor